MLRLGVNVDHVATLRQARGASYPDPLQAALAAERAGANAITVHLREDRRHIQDDDLLRIRRAIRIHFNQEMAATAEMEEIASELHPHEVCIVPERREELTTEGGLDADGLAERIAPIVGRLKAQKIRVSLFIDPEPHQVAAAARLGAALIELHTGHYARLADAEIANKNEAREVRTSTRRAHALRRVPNPFTLDGDAHRELEKLRAAAKLARSLKLQVNIGHGLNYLNVAPAAAIPGLAYAHIGHSIIARAIITGMERAVREMHALITHPARR